MAKWNASNLDNWTTQVRKGLLELCLFNLLAQGEMYGYDIVKRLAGIRGLVITEGTLYPLLSRLRKTGLLKTRLEESPSGPARKYYTLSDQGRQVLESMNMYWEDLTAGIEGLQSVKESENG